MPSVACQKTLDLTMINGYNGSVLSQGDLQSPTQTILFFEILGSTHSLGSSYSASKLTRVDDRHNGGCNFAFVDGHACRHRPNDTVTPLNMWLPQ